LTCPVIKANTGYLLDLYYMFFVNKASHIIRKSISQAIDTSIICALKTVPVHLQLPGGATCCISLTSPCEIM